MDRLLAKQLAAQLRKPTGEEGIKTGEWMNKGNTHITISTIEVLDPKAYDTILETGMGNGFFVPQIITPHPSIHYIGCDFSDIMVAEAERINAPAIRNGQVRFVLADMTTMPFDDAVFNKVFTINSIYFWEDAVAVLNEIKRVLHPAGKFILTLRPKHLMEKYPFTQFGFKMFSKEEVCALLQQNGFTVTEVLEKQEPDFELNGEMIAIEHLIVVAKKQ
ncbi:MAG: class I SAM-dependent methyltransferase [Ferruginibacter sp.]